MRRAELIRRDATRRRHRGLQLGETLPIVVREGAFRSQEMRDYDRLLEHIHSYMRPQSTQRETGWRRETRSRGIILTLSIGARNRQMGDTRAQNGPLANNRIQNIQNGEIRGVVNPDEDDAEGGTDNDVPY